MVPNSDSQLSMDHNPSSPIGEPQASGDTIGVGAGMIYGVCTHVLYVHVLYITEYMKWFILPLVKSIRYPFMYKHEEKKRKIEFIEIGS